MSGEDEDSNSSCSIDSFQSLEKSVEKLSFICVYDDCHKSYTRLAHLKRHEDTHDGNYRCTEGKCGMNFKSKYTLKKHIDNIHLKKNPKKYKCQDCDEEFNKRNWLTRHRYRHTGVKPYTCSVEGCQARFLVPSKLKRHMKTHEGYTCTKENCGEHFLKWTLYTNHLKISHPPIFKCNYCEKQFLRSNNLQAHLEVHKSDREVFLCPKQGCSRFYFMKRNLTHHLKSYHDKRPFTCIEEHCSKAFKSEAALNAHLSRHDPTKRIRKKKKKSKPKPSFAEKLAGFAPKKWQVESLIESRTDVVASSDKFTSKSKENQDEFQLTSTEDKQEVMQLTIAREYQDVPHITCAEERNHDIQSLSEIENDASYCSTNNEIMMLLNMIEKRKGFETESTSQNTKYISIEA